MLYPRFFPTLAVCAFITAACAFPAHARQVKTVFAIAIVNHNCTQPANQFTGGIQQIYQNPNAPFINSLVNGTASAVFNGSIVNISEQVAYATAYANVLATPSGNNPHIHPSEPNYIWAEGPQDAISTQVSGQPRSLIFHRRGINDSRAASVPAHASRVKEGSY